MGGGESGGGRVCSSPLGDWAFASRYQRVSPDVLPFGNGRKPCLRACKEHDATPDHATTEGKPPLRTRSLSGSANPSPTRDHQYSFPSDSSPAQCDNRPPSAAAAAAAADSAAATAQNHHHHNHQHREVNGLSPDRGGDVLLQWGHNKRSRGSRAESRTAGDESSAPSRHKVQRRSAAAAAMPPPPCGSYTRGANRRPLITRGVEDRSNGLTQSGKRSPASLPEKARKASAKAAPNSCAAADVSTNPESSKRPSDLEMGSSGAATAGEKLNLDKFEWPRIYISLSRKEKEDDFLAMKGTKLPHRPKKRAKNIEKALQYCFPGMWLSDLTRGRYEVREKKCVKKKRAGLKAMESLDSDSE